MPSCRQANWETSGQGEGEGETREDPCNTGRACFSHVAGTALLGNWLSSPDWEPHLGHAC